MVRVRARPAGRGPIVTVFGVLRVVRPPSACQRSYPRSIIPCRRLPVLLPWHWPSRPSSKAGSHPKRPPSQLSGIPPPAEPGPVRNPFGVIRKNCRSKQRCESRLHHQREGGREHRHDPHPSGQRPSQSALSDSSAPHTAVKIRLISATASSAFFRLSSKCVPMQPRWASGPRAPSIACITSDTTVTTAAPIHKVSSRS